MAAFINYESRYFKHKSIEQIVMIKFLARPKLRPYLPLRYL